MPSVASSGFSSLGTREVSFADSPCVCCSRLFDVRYPRALPSRAGRFHGGLLSEDERTSRYRARQTRSDVPGALSPTSARLHATNSWRTGRGGAHCARRPILKKARANASSLAGIALRDAAAPVHRRVPRPPHKEGENAVSGDGPCLARMYVVCTRHPAWLRPSHVGASSLAAVCRFWNAPGPL